MQKSKQYRKKSLKALGEAIRNRRVELGLTQEELGSKAELHRTYITDIENGLRNLSFLTMRKVAIGLACRLSALLAEAESAEVLHHEYL